MPAAYRWSPAAKRIGMPPPFGVSDAAVLTQELLLLLWLPLGYFVWRRRSWAVRVVAYSSLLLGTAQCVQNYGIFGPQSSHDWLNIVSAAIILTAPSFLLSAIAFCLTTRSSSGRSI